MGEHGSHGVACDTPCFRNDRRTFAATAPSGPSNRKEPAAEAKTDASLVTSILLLPGELRGSFFASATAFCLALPFVPVAHCAPVTVSASHASSAGEAQRRSNRDPVNEV